MNINFVRASISIQFDSIQSIVSKFRCIDPTLILSLFYNWIDVKKIMNPTNITPLENRGVFRVVEMEAEWGYTTYLSYKQKTGIS